jgi:hypothetical protein
MAFVEEDLAGADLAAEDLPALGAGAAFCGRIREPVLAGEAADCAGSLVLAGILAGILAGMWLRYHSASGALWAASNL